MSRFVTYEDVIAVPCSLLKTLPQKEIEKAVDIVIDYYYEKGFPYYEGEKRSNEFSRMTDFDVSRLELPDNNLQQFMLGLSTANYYHPEMWHVRCNKAKTPYEVFTNRELFKTALLKRIKYSDTPLYPYNIRKSLKAFGAQSVSNFRPTIAKWVYTRYAPVGGDVLDPCAGYGGRLMGAMSSHLKSYTGVDPNTVTQSNNKRMVSDFYTSTVKVELVSIPFEEYDVTSGYYDLVFTSPPYFNIEKYSEDENQSWVRYKTMPVWIDSFLRPLIRNSMNGLKHGGYFAINVGGQIVDETYNIGCDMFGSRPEIYHMRLSKILGNGKKAETSHKTEPIMIWRKNENLQ